MAHDGSYVPVPFPLSERNGEKATQQSSESRVQSTKNQLATSSCRKPGRAGPILLLWATNRIFSCSSKQSKSWDDPYCEIEQTKNGSSSFQKFVLGGEMNF
jgi:hypothetical protein